MKSFRQFIIEEKIEPRFGESEAQERLIKKLNRIKKKGNIPDNPFKDTELPDGSATDKPDVAKNQAAQDIRQSGGSDPRFRKNPSASGSGTFRDEDPWFPDDKKKPLTNTTKGGEVKIINPKDPNKPRTPKASKGELGKLYKSGTKSDPKRAGSVRTTDKINAKLRAQRRARINP